MPRLNLASQKAIDRLRNYRPPPTNYDLVPLSRRAAVLLLLYADAKGDLRVVLTIRAKTLSSYAGQAALPGGRADSLEETAFQTARREAREEIGLPDLRQQFPQPFKVEHLCEFPANLARTELVVRPCVALLHSYDGKTGENADPEVSLIPRLDAREVAAVFTASFHNFLRMRDGDDWGTGDPAEWYQGAWTEWHQSNWRMHQFFVPIDNRTVVKPRSSNRTQNLAADQLKEKEESGEVTRYLVFGMTARILVDVARVAYGEEPEFEHNSHFGDEDMIANLRRMGRLSAVRKATDELTRETMQKAAKLS
ncbi:NUDIX hydrolase [Aspergillus clavatus NRRL 1]|uniref:NUDIX domain protein n=1 Tax=Aspergillus clavatus (strain ATCC 1007 / CBS 513.65 / DSM 816 / NCTC 3887 / NRRL 1 / QM 1276 / 107) TaxID=344612 RepID=A1CJU1_ASPCL|nr:NUDIX domain protein [Aspergillus clavatus NRRL 1]EAW09415.1 NUDIX domain protein [Aspergillus clavatus NRRL 1]